MGSNKIDQMGVGLGYDGVVVLFIVNGEENAYVVSPRDAARLAGQLIVAAGSQTKELGEGLAVLLDSTIDAAQGLMEAMDAKN